MANDQIVHQPEEDDLEEMTEGQLADYFAWLEGGFDYETEWDD